MKQLPLTTAKTNISTIYIAGLAIVAVYLLFMINGHIGVNLWDEGFLWYGAQRTILGELPIRDFMAYDPGRYFWSAIWMSNFGDTGLLALRASVAIFQSIGLFLGLKLIYTGTHTPNKILLTTALIILCLWMYPRHKLFDISISIALISTLTCLIQHPTNTRYLLAGIVIGMAAVFGRNHGIYGTWGLLVSIVYLKFNNFEFKPFMRELGYCFLGVIIGFSPILALMIIADGFASAFWGSILSLLKSKATNHPLPIPWPWTVKFDGLLTHFTISSFITGLFFVFVWCMALIGLLYPALRKYHHKPLSPQLCAAFFLALPYAHFATSRADVAHLAQGIFPALISIFIVAGNLSTLPRNLTATTLVITTAIIMLPLQPSWQGYFGNWPSINIGNDQIVVSPTDSKDIELLTMLNTKYASNNQQFVVTPFWPGAYAMLNRKSPMWEIYALAQNPSTEFQQEEIRRIEKAEPKFILILDVTLDGKEERRFTNTHALITDYIDSNFRRAPTIEPSEQVKIYLPR